jgi:hypothetical protein
MPIDYIEASPSIRVESVYVGVAHIPVSREMEAQAISQCDNFYSLISMSGMSETPVPVSKFVAECFSRLVNVQSVLAGHSDDVLHVWIMIDEWDPEVRKKVYSIQKQVMKDLEGLHFDFYVIDIPDGTQPEEMVTGIPVIFNRAK